jgi:hypothetical protein
MKSKFGIALLYVIGFSVGSGTVRFILNNISRGPASSDQVNLRLLVTEMNKSMPKKIDELTTLIGVDFSKGRFSYIYHANVTKEQFDSAYSNITASIDKSACEQSFTKMVLTKRNHPIQYIYIDDNKKELGRYVVAPEFCLK